jgi:hypothetical protein
MHWNGWVDVMAAILCHTGHEFSLWHRLPIILVLLIMVGHCGALLALSQLVYTGACEFDSMA